VLDLSRFQLDSDSEDDDADEQDHQVVHDSQDDQGEREDHDQFPAHCDGDPARYFNLFNQVINRRFWHYFYSMHVAFVLMLHFSI
jgi:hypothetical protein